MDKELFVYSPYKSKFKEQVSSGAVDDSQIGIIAESGELWVKGTYLPIVDLSKKANISKGVIEADGFKDVTGTTFLTPNRGIDPANTLATQKYVTEATTNFAKDLTGVIEATPEEFTYRPSAGNKSIRDASAVIRRIKGNTVVWAQCCKNPYLELNKLYNKNQSNASYTNTDGGLRITYNSDGNPPDFYLFATQLGNLVKGHIYMISIDARVSRGLNVEMSLYPNYDTVLLFHPNGEWNRYAGLYTLTRDTFTNYYYVGISKRTTTTINVGDYFEFRNAQFIDLTRLFGAGNEPKTIEEFQSKFPDSYYPYSEPEVRNVITNQITTIGFNQWDEQWELGALGTNNGATVANHERGRSVNFFDVIPNASYYCATIAPTTTNSGGTVGSMLVWWYDSSYAMIKYEDITNKIRVAPSNARYAKICSYGGDVNAIFNGGVNINLSHSKVRNGEYEPYKRNIRLLPEIYKYFPDGMNGNANVWDEINAESAIKRWGVVDLGSLTWSAEETNTSGVYRWASKGISAFPTATVSTIPNIICAKYTTGSNDNTYGRRDCVTISTSGRVRIFDSQYQEKSSKEAFVASLQGVYLYYELAEPIETPITEAIQLDYVVDDFGTEKASGFGNSAPFRADIVYQFNAEGRIRDNSRNIERVESNMQKVENTITTRLIPSQTAMLGLPNKVMTWDGNKTLMSLPIAESIDGWELEESPYGVLPTGKQVKDYISSITNRLIPSQTAMLGLPNKVMTWNGSSAMMSLPIAEDIDHWDLKESSLGTIPTSQQVREYIKSITDKLIPSQSATLESSNRVMVWNGDYAMTSLPIAANFTEWADGAIPTGQQVMDYISAIKGSLATGLIPKEALTIDANGVYLIFANKAYEVKTASNTNYNVGLHIVTTDGVDAAADNEWRIRIDARTGFGADINIKPFESGYTIRWAYPESGAGTAPNITAGYIWDIQFRMIGKTLLGTYKKY